MQVVRVNQRAVRTADPAHFAGTVWNEQVLGVAGASRLYSSLVTFAPGGRSNWHRHKLGQVLYCLSGVGRVQRAGGPVQEVRPGDTVLIQADEVHWHGASPDRALTHLTMAEVSDSGEGTVWLQAVTDAEFQAPVAPEAI